MSTLKYILSGQRVAANLKKDPNLIQSQVVISSVIATETDVDAQDSAFWSSDVWNDTTLTVADTYTTLLDVSDSPYGGYVSAILGAAYQNNGDSCSFEITVDGEQYILDYTGNAARRELIGPLKSASQFNSNDFIVPALYALNDNANLLYYEKSILIRHKIEDIHGTNYLQADKAGVSHLPFGRI